ncbi:MAG TPA: cytochrome c [Chitinophagaceae bacterium]|nr:cytochrome c [Chitinophagaceae bacterium]
MYRTLTVIVFAVLCLLMTTASCGDDNGARVIDGESMAPIDTTTKRGGEGKMVFTQKCASCHSVLKDMAGPALTKVAVTRDSAWIFKFLTNRKLIKEDSISQSFKREFPNIDCQIFPDLTRENVGQILKYIEEAQHPHY